MMLGAVAVLISGCITHEETVYKDVERAKVEFESDGAGRVFYEAMNKDVAKRRKRETTTRVDIPIVFDHKRKVVVGESVFFNESVSHCDTNRDGRITEMEARIYAEQVERK